MPAALTPEEIRERSMKKYEEKMAAASAPQAAAPKEEETVVRDSAGRENEERVTRKRNAFNGTTAKIGVNRSIPGYDLYGFNDYPNRVEQALAAGWEFVTPEEIGYTGEDSYSVDSKMANENGKVRWWTGTHATGVPMYTYLMKIKSEWRQEDEAELQKKNDRIDQQIRQADKTEGFYRPQEGIKLGYN